MKAAHAEPSTRRRKFSRPGAQKKAPGKAVSQGGRGQQPFPGAIGRSCIGRCASPMEPGPVSDASLVSEAYRRLPCRRAASWSAGRPSTPSRCRPIHMDRCFLTTVRCAPSVAGVSALRGGRIWESQNRVKGGFSRVLPPLLQISPPRRQPPRGIPADLARRRASRPNAAGHARPANASSRANAASASRLPRSRAGISNPLWLAIDVRWSGVNTSIRTTVRGVVAPPLQYFDGHYFGSAGAVNGVGSATLHDSLPK